MPGATVFRDHKEKAKEIAETFTPIAPDHCSALDYGLSSDFLLSERTQTAFLGIGFSYRDQIHHQTNADTSPALAYLVQQSDNFIILIFKISGLMMKYTVNYMCRLRMDKDPR